MTTEESVINWLEARGVDCDDARNAMRHVMGYDVSGMDDIASEYRKSCRALCVVAAIRLGVEFKVRTGLATVATYESRAYIGGNKDNPFDLDPWLALVALVEADNDRQDPANHHGASTGDVQHGQAPTDDASAGAASDRDSGP